MDRDSLTTLLARGVSVEKIAQRFGKHPSTVSYWMAKYGLEAPNREKHAAKGGIAREQLEQFIEAGMTIAEIAATVDLSRTTVRHWLGRYGLKTRNKVGPRLGIEAKLAKEAGQAQMVSECPRHGTATYVMEGRGYYRCGRCRSESVANHRRRLKALLIDEAGGKCVLCGYDRQPRALTFHHVNPLQKGFALSQKGVTLSLEALRAEARKCVLLCSNCHAEVEDGFAALPDTIARARPSAHSTSIRKIITQ